MPWLDPLSSRRVYVLCAATELALPEAPAWPSSRFALLLLTEHVVNAAALARRALEQGLVFVSTWGPGCELIDEDLDEVIAAERPVESPDDAVLTTTHADESLEEAFDFFLDAALPAPAHVEQCQAWVVLAPSPALTGRIERALARRQAHPEPD